MTPVCFIFSNYSTLHPTFHCQNFRSFITSLYLINELLQKMDKSEEKREYTCIECGGSVKNLYKKYSETVLKLTRCDACNKIADKYVEYDPVIIIIDLILLRVMAYRHFLLNTEIKNFWKLSIILLLLETYLNWTLVTKGTLLKQEMNDTKPDLTESDVSLDDFKFYKLFLTTTINTFCFVLTIYLCTVFYTLFGNRKRISFVTAGKTVTLSSTGLFLFLPSLIWDLSVHDFHLHFVSLYTTLSQLVAYKVLCGCEKLWTLFVIFSSILCKIYLGDYLNTFLL